jgi:two-component system response regulator
MEEKVKRVVAIIEDNESDKEMIEQYFCHNDLDVHFIEDGQDALNFLDENEPSLIVLDLNLPKINGFEILEKLRKVNKKCIVIILTTSSERSSISKAYDLFANAYIVKPIDSKDYEKLLTRTSDFWFNVAELIDNQE